MEYRSDGRKFARITRKSAELIGLLRRGTEYDLDGVSALIETHDLQEFYIDHLKKFISQIRVRDYLRFLVRLKILSEVEGKFSIALVSKPTTDAHKVQLLADRAGIFLANQLGVQPASVQDTLQASSQKILRSGQLPTLDQVAANTGISNHREEELFRWAAYLFLDESRSMLSLKHSPVLVKK